MGAVFSTGSPLVMVLGGLELLLVGFAFYCLSRLVGTADTNNDLVKTVLPITGTLGGIVMLHTGMWFLYSTYHPSDMTLYFLLSTSMSLILSLVAISMALVNKA